MKYKVEIDWWALLRYIFYAASAVIIFSVCLAILS